jgi:hypothetical protein
MSLCIATAQVRSAALDQAVAPPLVNSCNVRSQMVGDREREIEQLVAVLNNAYKNSLAHQWPDSRPDQPRDSEIMNEPSDNNDRVLESSSICLASRLFYEIVAGTCQLKSAARNTNECALRATTGELESLSDTLSATALRLQSFQNSYSVETAAKSSNLQLATFASMEHLYRAVLTISHAYLDPPQGETYLQIASAQIQSAIESIKAERDLCRCDEQWFEASLQDLSVLDQKLAQQIH